ncbi:MAG TPA: peptidylprolyl isomerase [Chloroflexia bacterium]|nr:peptidylprolyl isomerase [Chloroflexia bacterium]
MSSNRPRNTSSQKPGAGGNRPAGRPTASNVRVSPTRPQAAARRGAPPPPPPRNSLLPLLLGGGLAILILGGLYFAFLMPKAPDATPTPAPGAVTIPTPDAGGSTGAVATPAAANLTPAGGDAIAVVETSKGSFKIQLFTDDPVVRGTVENFRNKATSGYFNGKTFHRVEDWVIQGGDPTGTGSGGGNIPGEYSASHSFVRGAVGMASTAGHAAEVNDSQWFVTKKDSSFLDGNYAIFGQVIDGLDVVDKIAIGDTMTKITMQPANTGISGGAATATPGGVPTGTPGSPTAPATSPTPGGTPSGAAGAEAGGGKAGGSTAVVQTPKGTFKIKLFADDPVVARTVKNFQDKATAGYFDGKVFHRVEDWVVQGGDPTGTGTGGKDDLPGEYSTTHSFLRGGVGMASKGAKGATVNDSQWFVTKKDSQFLDGSYAIFGQVTEGLDVVDKIAIGDTMTKVTLQP